MTQCHAVCSRDVPNYLILYIVTLSRSR